MTSKCVLCKQDFEGYGNNAQPLAEGFCCDECDVKVLKERLRRAGNHPKQTKIGELLK